MENLTFLPAPQGRASSLAMLTARSSVTSLMMKDQEILRLVVMDILSLNAQSSQMVCC